MYKNREVNSKRFENAEQLQNYIAETEGSIVFKLAVKIDQTEPIMAISPFMKAYFTYRPDRDNFLEWGGKCFILKFFNISWFTKQVLIECKELKIELEYKLPVDRICSIRTQILEIKITRTYLSWFKTNFFNIYSISKIPTHP